MWLEEEEKEEKEEVIIKLVSPSQSWPGELLTVYLGGRRGERERTDILVEREITELTSRSRDHPFYWFIVKCKQ